MAEQQHRWEGERCAVCGNSQYAKHVRRRTAICPGVPLVAYGVPWPEHLATKTQIERDLHRRLAPDQPVVMAYPIQDPPYWRFLYDTRLTQPKREASEAQRAALEKGRLRQRTCQACQHVYSRRITGMCWRCAEITHRYHAGAWARHLLELPADASCFLDTETTGLLEQGGRGHRDRRHRQGSADLAQYTDPSTGTHASWRSLRAWHQSR